MEGPKRIFRILALYNGYKLDWDKGTEKEMIDSSKKTLLENDRMPLQKLIFRCIGNDIIDSEIIKSLRN